MPEKRRLSLSFSLTQREQRNAWERLSAVGARFPLSLLP